MGLTEKEHIEFNEWAFGADIRKTVDTRMCAFVEWNKRHGDLLTLKKCDSITDSCKKMIVLWQESKTVIITDENKK